MAFTRGLRTNVIEVPKPKKTADRSKHKQLTEIERLLVGCDRQITCIHCWISRFFGKAGDCYITQALALTRELMKQEEPCQKNT